MSDKPKEKTKEKSSAEKPVADSINFTALIQEGLELPEEKKFYFNGFAVSISPSDFTIVINHNNQPVAYLNSSHSVTKTMIRSMLTLLEKFEQESGQTILSLDELQKALSKKDDKSK